MITTLKTAAGTYAGSSFASSKLVVRSTSAADNDTLALSGVDGATARLNNVDFADGLETLSANTFTKVNSAVVGLQAGTVELRVEGTKANGFVFFSANPALGDTLTIGLAGNTVVYTFDDIETMGTANYVLVGATAADTLANLAAAINDSGTEGTNYGTGTLANPYVSASIANNVLTITDLIGCNRALGWACSTTSSAIGVTNPVGGVDGALVLSLYTGQTSVFAPVNLDDESLNLALLPPYVAWVSDPVAVNGKSFTLHLSRASGDSPVASYQYSTELTPTVWRSGLTTMDFVEDQHIVATPAEHVEWVRLLLDNSANATAISVNAKLCSE